MTLRLLSNTFEALAHTEPYDVFEAFFQAPFHAYGPGSPYVSPLHGDLRRMLSRANPLLRDTPFALFVVERDGVPVGRITAHSHPASNRAYGTQDAAFGFFDCADDAEAAGMLLGAAEAWARAHGFTRIAGNFNLTAMQQIGIMTDGFSYAAFLDQMWNAPWIPRLLETHGYTARFPMTTFALDPRLVDTDALAPPALHAALDAQGVTFEPVTRRNLAACLEHSRAVLNTAFRDNPMFVPPTQEEYAFQADGMRWILDPRLSSVAMCKGEPVGAIVVVPDANPLLRAVGSRLGWTAPFHYLRHRLSNRRAVVVFQGVMPAFQRQGLNPAMLARSCAALVQAGYTEVGGTWIADSNTASLRQVEKVGGKPLHRLHLFGKDLAAPAHPGVPA